MSLHIIEFSVENYGCFKDKTTLSMIAAKTIKEHSEFLIPYSKGNLLKASFVYGANSSGKSVLVQALQNMLHFMNGAYEEILYNPFRFNGMKDKDSTMSLTFEVDGVLYNYTFSYKKDLSLNYAKAEITHEKLSYFSKGRECLLFERDKDINVKWGTKFVGNKKAKNLVPSTRLLFTILGSWKREDFCPSITPLFKAIYSIDKELSSFKEDSLQNREEMLYELIYNNDDLQIWMNAILKNFDFGIESFKMSKDYIRGLPTHFGAGDYVKIKHPVFTYSNGEESVESGVMSSGLKELFNLLPYLYSSVKTGTPMFIDGDSLHPMIKEKLISLWTAGSTWFNPLNAQLIWVTHDISILNNGVRRDTVWFVQKDDSQISHITALCEYDIKKFKYGNAFGSMYLVGHFNALPCISTENICLSLTKDSTV